MSRRRAFGWSLMWLAILLSAVASAHATTPPVQGFRHQYRVQVGDLNADGRQDIYVRQVPRLLPVGSDPSTLIPKPDDVGEFVLRGNSTGHFSLVTSLTSSQTAAARQWPLRPGLKVLPHDYNADGLRDVLVGNVAAEIPGAFDVIVYAGATRGAPPVTVKNVDVNLQKFTRDVQNFLDNPYYFDPAISVQCGVQYRYVWVYYYDAGWILELQPSVVCYYVFDTASFSIDAVEFLYYFIPFLDAGRMMVPSVDAMNVDRMLREVFGVEFLKGVLQDNGSDDTSLECWLAWPCPEYQRLARILEMLIFLDKGTVDVCRSGPTHDYSVDTMICTTGGKCSTQNVYKEQVSHPAPGYEKNIVPVRHGDSGFAELGYPGFPDNLGWIVFSLNPPVLMHHNITTDQHVIHQGSVTRQTVLVGASVRIRTHGSGSGGCVYINEKFGKSVFESIDHLISGHIHSGFVDNHPAVQ